MKNLFFILSILVFLNQTKVSLFASHEYKNLSVVPAGPFEMGSNKGEKDEGPVHKVYVNQFIISKYEVTNNEYNTFVREYYNTPQRFADDLRFNAENNPVVGVSWFDANTYCKWKKMRLPTEAEWEKAARGTDGRLYPWGNDFIQGLTNFASTYDNFVFTAPVGSFKGNVSPYGLFDTLGNVWEWVNDWYGEKSYSMRDKNNLNGPLSGKKKVLRGGSWFNDGETIRVTKRYKSTPLNRSQTYGIRCARNYIGKEL